MGRRLWAVRRAVALWLWPSPAKAKGGGYLYSLTVRDEVPHAPDPSTLRLTVEDQAPRYYRDWTLTTELAGPRYVDGHPL